MPDFDIDFCQEGRDRVIEYVRAKYGAQSVSQIATFGTMAAKAVVRDVGRVLGMGYGEVDRIAKLIPFELGITLDKAIEAEPQLKALIAEQEEVAELMRLAKALEGLTRNVGMHAGGVLIAPGRLTDFAPLYSADGSTATVSQFDKDDVEKAGLVKFDFLGLTTLTIIAESERHIRAMGAPGLRHPGDPARRSRGLQGVLLGQHRRDLPVRIARHARPHHEGEARPAGGPHRAERALPAGPDGPDPRVHRTQARPPALGVPRPAAQGDPRPHLRRHDLPGARHDDRAGDRRLHARRRRPPAARHGQEEARGDGPAARDLPQGGDASAGWRRGRRASSSTRWRSSRATASTSRTPRPTRWSPTRRPTSRRTTRRRSARPTCRRS